MNRSGARSIAPRGLLEIGRAEQCSALQFRGRVAEGRVRGFARIDLGAGGVPEATTPLNLRLLLESNDLCKGLFKAINAELSAQGLLLREGTLVGATLIAAPPWTRSKDRDRQRDPELHQTKKGNQWQFGMKAHIGAERDSKLVHTVVVTPARVADIRKTAELLHGPEQQVHAGAGCTGVEKRPGIVALESHIDWQKQIVEI